MTRLSIGIQACVVTALCAATALPISAQQHQALPTYQVLYSFNGFTDGSTPSYSPLLRDSSGNLYGTTLYGGTSRDFEIGFGVVFELSSTGQETVLHSFTGGTDGGYPSGALLLDSAGNLYGTATQGGLAGGCGGMGCGIVFKLSPSGEETVLYTFSGGADGGNPGGGLIKDSAGILYGTAGSGGAYGYGVVFKVNLAGRESVLYSFQGGMDGEYPGAGVIRDSAGNLYGTTSEGGLSNGCLDGDTCGVVFEIGPSGQETVLYRFMGGSDGETPAAGLVRDSTGNLYGTTLYGGGTCSNVFGCGTVFKLDPSGIETVLYRFSGGHDGSHPLGGLVRDRFGNLYGTTLNGGDFRQGIGSGVVFQITAAGERVLYTFKYGPDGSTPSGTLVRDASGNLYGMASEGGEVTGCEFAGGCGVVFELVATD